MLNENITKSFLLDLTYKINGAAIAVHKSIGPGLLESIYKKCLESEFSKRGIQFESELVIPIKYNEISFEEYIRCDFLIEKSIVLEIKSVNELTPIFKAQTLTYMNLLKAPKGILINFNVENLYFNGQMTFVNSLYKDLK